jgi:hypothetical protein
MMADDALRASMKLRVPHDGPFVGVGVPPPEATAFVGWDQFETFPAYMIGGDGSAAAVPFTPTLQFPPIGYQGDYYAEEFADEKIKSRWLLAREDPEQAARVRAMLRILGAPHEFRVTGTVVARGRIDPHGDVDLAAIRRPAFFGEAPWREPIAALEERTSVIEFMVPREALERIRLGRADPVKLRGWHIAGDGVDDGSGRRKRATMVMVAGRTVETTATSHPNDFFRAFDYRTGRWGPVEYPKPGCLTEMWAARAWRKYILEMARAGFDVLTFDKRGHGISGGLNDSNMGEQADDIIRALDAFESGEGLRILTPDGRLLSGLSAAGRLLSGTSARAEPVIVAGPSQGSMVSSWAMHKNYVENRSYELPHAASREPYGYNLISAILLAPFTSGLGYRAPDEALLEAAHRLEVNIQAFPSSEILANVHRWPSVFVGRGLWDFAESLEGTFEVYRRAKGLKEITVVRGPHAEGEWGDENIDFMIARMKAFARAAVHGHAASLGAAEPRNLRELVAFSPDTWEETSAPGR